MCFPAELPAVLAPPPMKSNLWLLILAYQLPWELSASRVTPHALQSDPHEDWPVFCLCSSLTPAQHLESSRCSQGFMVHQQHNTPHSQSL